MKRTTSEIDGTIYAQTKLKMSTAVRFPLEKEGGSGIHVMEEEDNVGEGESTTFSTLCEERNITRGQYFLAIALLCAINRVNVRA